MDGHFTQQMLSVARQWQNLGLRPDFGCDWGPDILFQYSSRTGETVTYQRTPSGSVLVLPNDAGYERVFGATQAQTDRSLPHWRAYNDTQLIGLDPNRYYFLDNAPRDSAQLHINALSPDVYISETRITDQAALFRLEKNDVPLEMDLLAKTPFGKNRNRCQWNRITSTMGRNLQRLAKHPLWCHQVCDSCTSLLSRW